MTTVLKGVECFQRTGAREGTAREAVNWSWPKTEAACGKKKSNVEVRQNILTVVQKKKNFYLHLLLKKVEQRRKNYIEKFRQFPKYIINMNKQPPNMKA